MSPVGLLRDSYELAAGEHIDWHLHTNHHQLLLPRSGALEVSAGADTWLVRPGSAAWLPAGVMHSHVALETTAAESVLIDRDLDVSGSAVAMLFDATTVPELFETRLDGDELRVCVASAVRNAAGVTVPPIIEPPVVHDSWLRALEAMLHETPSDVRSIASFGAVIGASERTVRRLVRSELDLTFAQWRTRIRIYHAMQDLAGGASVTATAYRCGYRNPSTFIETFRGEVGITPGAWRTGHKRQALR